jgi:hypothetical protein
MQYVVIYVDLFIAGVFAVSAAGKLRDWNAFAASVRDLGGVPAHRARAVARLVVALECLTAVLVLIPAAIPATAGRLLAAGLLAAFTIVLIRARRRTPGLACHCFGPGTAAVAGRHVARNLLLIAAVPLGEAERIGAAVGAVNFAGFALCLLVAGVSVAAVALLDDLAALLRPLPSR